MDIPPQKRADFVKRPPDAVRLVVLYGQEAGLAREIAQGLIRSVCGGAADDFQLVSLTPEDLKADPARLLDEAQAIPMFGGRRVVHVRDGGDGLAGAAGDLLDTPGAEALTIVEAIGLSKTSKLVKIASGSGAGAAIACYPDSARDLSDVIREMLSEAGLTATPEAQGLLLASLGDNRADTRSRLDTLILYKGEERSPVSAEDVRAVLADSPDTRIGDLADAVLAGKVDRALALLDRCLENAIAPGGILRFLGGQVRQVRKARAMKGPPDKMALMRMFRLPLDRAAAMVETVRRWDEPRLAQAERVLFAAERASRAQSANDAAIVGQAVIALARLGARGR